MSLQLAVQIHLPLQGDGTSTVWKFHLNQLPAYGIYSSVQGVDFGVSPNSVTLGNTNDFSPITYTVSVSGGVLTFTFSSAPASGQVGNVSAILLWNSQ